MAKYGSNSFDISIAGTSIKNYIDTLNGFEIEALLAETHAFGDSWEEHLATGVKRGNPFTIGGFYDDTASTGPDVLLNAIGTTVAVILTYGSTKTSSFSALIRNYKRMPARGELTRFECELVPSGAVTEA